MKALLGNAIGGILIMVGGISAMRHAEKHINLEEVSDEELLTHPIFIHNFIMCIIAIFGMILYFVPAWILWDVYNWVSECLVHSELFVYNEWNYLTRRVRHLWVTGCTKLKDRVL